MAELIRLPELELDSGRTLTDVPVAYDAWGELNAAADNAIIVCHALTGNTEAAVWWGGLIGSGQPLDTDRYFVICLNVLGSPYGSVSPLTIDAASGRPYGPDFPDVTIRDTVRAHRAVLELLGVRRAVMALGGSMGGMQALEWAFEDDFVEGIVPIAVGGRHSAWCIGFSEAQRQAIYSDRRWNGGHYDEQPQDGLAAARMIAMISYRSHRSFERRFGRSEQEGVEGLFAVESYLRYQGRKLVGRFDANCYVKLSQQMDSHDMARDRGDYAAVVSGIRHRTLVIGIDSDVLYPVEEQEELASLIPNARLEIIPSVYGHDAFLIELGALGGVLRSWMDAELKGAETAAEVLSEGTGLTSS
jgi:homoserine O-acetyltransferase